jgi:hypothetical protein
MNSTLRRCHWAEAERLCYCRPNGGNIDAEVVGVTPSGSSGPVGLPTAKVQAPMVQTYTTDVKGDNVMVDTGSLQRVHQGSRLAFFKPSAPSTRAGVIEVSQVIVAGDCRAGIATPNTGRRLGFSDVFCVV